MKKYFNKIATANYSIHLLVIILLNFIIKSIAAFYLELGNDEVYYISYAKFPDWSHFDHPPLVGILIKLSTLNFLFTSEFFIRLGALILSSVNIVLIFLIGKELKNEKTGYFASLLYVASIYLNIISGLFILPDTPQIFFCTLSMYFLVRSIFVLNPGFKEQLFVVLSGLFIGLGFLSKYHSLYIWFAVILYVLVYNRNWLRKPGFYLGGVITLLLMYPVYYWNLQNDFISFGFHGNRVGIFSGGINYISFMQFTLGQVFYQHPVVFVLFLVSIFSFKKRQFLNKPKFWFMLFLALPLIGLFTLFSLSKFTLPHWSGPGYLSLLFISGSFVSSLESKRWEKWLNGSVISTFVIIIFGTIEINTGLISNKIHMQNSTEISQKGKSDFTLDMYGWKQLNAGVAAFNKSKNYSLIISEKWFPAAHIDYYIANQQELKLIALGSLSDIHKYYWINKHKVYPEKSDDAIFITSSHNYRNPNDLYGKYFEAIIPADTIPIIRRNDTVKYHFIYILDKYNGKYQVK